MGRRERKRRKQAKVAQGETSPKAVPKWATAPQHEGRHLSWRFSAVDLDGEWTWTALPAERLPEVLDKLAQFEKMDYTSLRNFRSIHAVHTLVKDARDRLVDIQRDDVDRLFSYHIMGRERVWCAEYDGIMFVLWWDPLHTVYDTPKKRT